MILLNKGEITQQLIVTLNEKRTLADGCYLFYFVHILTKVVFTRIYTFAEDNSPYPERYNSFDFLLAEIAPQSNGFWTYQVFEQPISANADPTGLNEVECGIMRLDPATAFEFEKYDEPTSYKAYAG